ncbi:MAG: hypothetical protein E7675_08200 [Ruminococcaceae bacterium]|nr:hypothetical protein [Oscillospiraceae bacterium]
MKKVFSIILTIAMVASALSLMTVTSFADEGIVQDGLVSWFDGSEYEGTTWTDKKGENDITDCVDGTFKDGAYVLDKAQQLLPNELYDVLRGEEYTVEMNLGAFETYPDTGYATWLCNNSGTTAEKVSFYIQLNKGAMDTFKAKTSGIASSARPAFDEATTTLQNATLSITFKAGGETCVYVNGELMSSSASPAENANASVGSNPKFILGNAGVNNISNTAFEGLRFYSRALTADEVKQNADYDNAPKPAPIPEGPVAIEGTELTWELKDGVLTVAGTGAMPDYRNVEDSRPWVAYLDTITKVVVKTGVTHVGSSSFTHGKAITEVVIEESVESIGMDAFSCADTIDTMSLPKSLKTIGQGVVYSTTVTTVNYAGSEEDFAAIDKSAPYNDSIYVKNESGETVPAAGVVFGETVVTPPVTPPETGDATVYAIVFAVVAMLGMAVVVTKKVNA